MNNSQFLFFIIISIIAGLILGWVMTSGTKSQAVRLIDVFIIGPIMIYAGYFILTKSENLIHLIISLSLFIIGGSTISYNFKNYLASS